MAIIKLQNTDLILDTPYTVLSSDTASGVSSLTVKNITGFAINQILIIGDLGNQGSEIIKTHAATAPTGSTITLASATVYPHSSSTPIRVIQYDQAEFSTATTATGSKTVLATNGIWADNLSTNYIDNAGSSGYYFGRFKNTISSTFTAYSDPIPVTGFTLYSARTIINAALGEINKTTSEVLSNAFAYNQIDSCQMEVLRELKRWSFMQKFNSIIGQVTTGSWKVAVPTDLDDQNTNKSIYNMRLGKNARLVWVDKEKFDELIGDMAFTTLASTLSVGASTMVLTNSGDFGTSGTVTIGAYTYDFTANSTSTNTLTLTSVVPASENQAAGADVFLNPQSGLPAYWTTFGGYIYYTPITSATYTGGSLYLDYYSSQVMITSDSTNIVLPDRMIVVYYLCWKFLKKLNNGGETPESESFLNLYKDRVLKLKQKETLGRTFKMRPAYNNFAISMELDSSDSRAIRDGNFPNTGF